MGFTDYFLIVWDFIHFAKTHGVSVGPGRGSAAGSLVAYCLEITDLDPIAYDLLFERFLNPGRKSMPDIDIDFAVEGRERVINYVREKYGSRPRRADHHLLDDGRPRRRSRRGPRARGALRRRRQDREADPGRPGTDARRARPSCTKLSKTTHREGDPRARAAARRADARRLDPRRRRRDRRRAADQRRAAAAEGRRPGSRDAVLDEGHRGARPPEDGLPRAAQPRRDREGMRADRQPRHLDDPARRQEDLRDARARRRRRRLPVRVVGHARGAPPGEADASSTT